MTDKLHTLFKTKFDILDSTNTSDGQTCSWKNVFICICLIFAMFMLPTTLSASPTFSKPHGIYNRTIVLSIYTENPDAEIRYTLDGSEPSSKSILYESSFLIDKTTVIRAAEFISDSCCSNISTASYIFPNDIVLQDNKPVGYPQYWGKYSEISGIAVADYEMDPELISNRKIKNKVTNSFSTLPILSIQTNKDNLFSHENNPSTGGIYIYTGSPVGDGTGRGWKRPISLELFGGTSQYDLTVDCAIQMHGGHSRLAEKNPKHSFRITFNSDYGPSTLYYPIYGENNISEFNSLIIRTFFGDSWTIADYYNYQGQYIRDQWMRMMQKHMGYPYSNGVYVHTFINGLYWGIYNLSERIDDRYCKYHFGGKKSSYDVIKKEDGRIQASEGNLEKWNRLITLSAKSAQISAYNLIAGTTEQEPLLDVNNFIDYMILNFYVGNVDWDYHNWFAICNRDSTRTGFQFISWDGETIFYDLDTNLLDLKNEGCPSGLFHNLMQNNTFKHRFIDRAYTLLSNDGLLTKNNVVELWDSLYAEISDAVYAESARWGDYRRDVHPYFKKGELYTVEDHYAKERDRLLYTYFPKRTNLLIQQLTEKGWYANTPPPICLVNGSFESVCDTLSSVDILTFGKTTRIVYTTDGSDPVLWATSSKGTLGSTSKEYVFGTNVLSDIEKDGWFTLRAISQTAHGWSPTIEKKFYLDNSTAIPAPYYPERKEEMYDLNGRMSKRAKKGIYIKNGKKYIYK